MNIETINADIDVYYDEVLNNGFARDIADFHASINSQNGNIIGLRDVADKVSKALTAVVSGDLPESLSRLLPASQMAPFTAQGFDRELVELIDDKDVQQDQFFQKLQSLLQRLNQAISQNETRVFEVEKFIQPYLQTVEKEEVSEGEAHASIIFKDIDTTTSLTRFARTLHLWNRTLPLYHGLLNGDSPEDIDIVTVQNGSIDLIVSLNIDIAISLAEVMEIGFKVLGAYLSYKKLILPITQSYYGHKNLIAAEDQREKDLLENVGIAMKESIAEQHKAAKKKNKKIAANQAKAIDEVAKLLSAHVIKGNDFKLLTFVDEEVEDTGDEYQESEKKALSSSLNSASREARSMLKDLPEEDKIKLLEHYKYPMVQDEE